jgi:hypothetical protein
MTKLIKILDSKLPSGWLFFKEYSDMWGDNGAHVYKHLTKGVIIVQFDYSSGLEKISVDSGATTFDKLKNHLITSSAKEANEKAMDIMFSLGA